jgi:hypothetical protein
VAAEGCLPVVATTRVEDSWSRRSEVPAAGLFVSLTQNPSHHESQALVKSKNPMS